LHFPLPAEPIDHQPDQERGLQQSNNNLAADGFESAPQLKKEDCHSAISLQPAKMCALQKPISVGQADHSTLACMNNLSG
jgi:hypothetical protein